MTNKEAFHIGFLLGCAEEGVSGPEAEQLLTKVAAFLERSAGVLGDLYDGTKNLASLGIHGISGAAIALPVAAGAGAGYLVHKLQNHDVEPEDVRTQELIDELKHWARRAQEQRKTKLMRLAE